MSENIYDNMTIFLIACENNRIEDVRHFIKDVNLKKDTNCGKSITPLIIGINN